MPKAPTGNFWRSAQCRRAIIAGGKLGIWAEITGRKGVPLAEARSVLSAEDYRAWRALIKQIAKEVRRAAEGDKRDTGVRGVPRGAQRTPSRG